MEELCSHQKINCYECYAKDSRLPTTEELVNHSVQVWSNPKAIKDDRTKHLMALEIIRLRLQLSKKENV